MSNSKHDQFSQIVWRYSLETTDYAIMLRGAWGSGKTFFVKNFLIPKLMRSAKKSKKKPPKFFLHVSLHGVKDSREIDQRIFYSLAPFFQNVEVKRMGAIASAIASAISLGGIKLSLDDWLNYRMLVTPRLKETLIFFDDLERTDTNPISILKYISELVENHSLKAVIVTNEIELDKEAKTIEFDDLPDADGTDGKKCCKNHYSDDYLAVREKLIRYAFDFIGDYEDFVTSYASRFKKFRKLQDFLVTHIARLKAFNFNGVPTNFRILNDSLNTFSKLCMGFPKIVDETPNELSNLFLQIHAYTDFQLNSLTIRDFNEYCEANKDDHYFVPMLEHYYFAKKYGEEFLGLFYLHAPIKDYIDTGFFDKKAISEAIFGKPSLPKQVAKETLREWWKNEDRNIENAFNVVENEIEKASYTLSELVAIGIISLEIFIANLYQKQSNNLRQRVLEYIPEYAKNERKELYFRDLVEHEFIHYERLKKPEERKILTAFFDEVKKLLEKHNEEFFQNSGSNLLELFKTDPFAFKNKAYQTNKPELAKAFLSTLSTEKLSEILIKFSNNQLLETISGLNYLLGLISGDLSELRQCLASKIEFDEEKTPAVKAYWLRRIKSIFINEKSDF